MHVHNMIENADHQLIHADLEDMQRVIGSRKPTSAAEGLLELEEILVEHTKPMYVVKVAISSIALNAEDAKFNM